MNEERVVHVSTLAQLDGIRAELGVLLEDVVRRGWLPWTLADLATDGLDVVAHYVTTHPPTTAQRDVIVTDEEKKRAARVLAEVEAERLRLLAAQRARDLETARREQEAVDKEK